ncbi:MAG: stc [Firmicutes bacterium]|nr:stc [Bacillota bacterium]
MSKMMDKIYEDIDDSVNFSEETSIIAHSFELLKPDSCDIILLDSCGMILSGGKSHLRNEIADKTVERTSLQLEKFGVNGCPTFFLLADKKVLLSCNLKGLGDRIEKNFDLINSYKKKHDSLATYLDAIQEGISAIDKDGVLVFVNKACCEMLGATKEEILHKKADSISKERPLLLDVVKNKQVVVDKEYFMEFKNRSLHLTSSAYPVFDSQGEILGAIDLFRSIKRSRKLANLIAGKEASFRFENIVGDSKIMQDSILKAKRMALSDETILIEGSSGCGKELFAQAIHNYSHRKNEAFIAVNCANLPNELVESELFGYEDGAFTGATKGGKPGKFELANGGTLFLDEVGEMPMHIQSKLLRAVEYKNINRVGGSRTFNVDVRIIAATNRNLEDMVREGKFRGDLFYRLKVFYLRIPALAERGSDITELAEYYIRKLSLQMKKDVEGIDDEAKEILMKYGWPGNVRELENCMARAVFLCDGSRISAGNIAEAGIQIMESVESRCGSPGCHSLYELTSDRVREAYERSNRNKKKSAEILGISRPTLYKLLKLYNID